MNDYGGVQVRAGEETIKFMTRGEKFDTVRGMVARHKNCFFFFNNPVCFFNYSLLSQILSELT